MKETFEKLKEMLEKEVIALEDNYGDLVECIPSKVVLEIVNQVAEEYNQSLTNNNQKLTNDGWIPCSERLPDKTMLCLCTVERGVTPYHGLNPIIDWWIKKRR